MVLSGPALAQLVGVVFATAAQAYRCTVRDLQGPSRTRHFVRARDAAALTLAAVGLSHGQIGEVLRRERSSVTHMLVRANTRRIGGEDKVFAAACARVHAAVGILIEDATIAADGVPAAPSMRRRLVLLAEAGRNLAAQADQLLNDLYAKDT